MNNDAAQIEWLNQRVSYFRKQFARGLGRKATPIEAAALARAASWTARSELAQRDKTVTHNDAVRVDRLAAASRRDWERIKAAGRVERVPTLAE